MKRIVYSIIIFLFINLSILYIYKSRLDELKASTQDLKIQVYEVLEDENSDSFAIEEIELDFNDKYSELFREGSIVFIVTNLVFMLFVFGYIYINIIKPFRNLESYTLDLSKGILDKPLPIYKNSFFTKFSSSFDLMRETIITTRENEKKLVDNNKTVISTLSHDIKTPIAFIKLASENLKIAGISEEKRQRYLDVITSKVDEVIRLSDDLLLHSLSEIDKLIVEKEYIKIDKAINDIYNTFKYEYEIVINHPIPKVTINIEQKRLIQIFNNLFENSKKYANARVEISFEIQENNLKIYIQDDGDGIDAKDISFVFNKFYKANKTSDGSGLGLYIVKYIMEKVDGDINVVNNNGALFVLTFPIVENAIS